MILDIDNASREALIASGSRVVVAKRSGNAAPNVAWLAWEPLAHNILSWTETYGVYAADVPTADGAPIRARSSVYPAMDGATYPFGERGFEGPLDGSRIPPGHFDVVNRTAAAVAFGLLQEAAINREAVCAPVNVVVLPPGLTADFVSGPALYAWIHPAVVAGSTAHAPAGAAVAEFLPGTSARRCRYDRRTSRFIVEDEASWT